MRPEPIQRDGSSFVNAAVDRHAPLAELVPLRGGLFVRLSDRLMGR
jgi:hypothetical protein